MNHDAQKASGKNIKMIEVTHKFCEKIIRDLVVKMIIMDELPFITVQKLRSRNLIDYLEFRFKMPSRYTLMGDYMALYLRKKIKLKKRFSMNGYRVCLIIDTWMLIKNFNYIYVTGHFIDCSWTLYKRILLFQRVQDQRGFPTLFRSRRIVFSLLGD